MYQMKTKFAIKPKHTQETPQQQRVLIRDTALVGRRTVTPASLVLLSSAHPFFIFVKHKDDYELDIF